VVFLLSLFSSLFVSPLNTTLIDARTDSLRQLGD